MVVVYTSGRQDTEENILLGMDFTDKDRYLSFLLSQQYYTTIWFVVIIE